MPELETEWAHNPQVGPVPMDFTPGLWVGTPKPNASYRVDVNRGTYIRFTSIGEAIYMHHDQPGVFLNEVNRPVSAEKAKEAGYDTENLMRLRRRNEARNAAVAAIDAEYNISTPRKVLEERGEYRIVELYEGQYNVEFVDGTVMNARGPVHLELAQKIFRQSLNEPEPAPIVDPKGKK
jgi:hypothetical protein